MNHVVREDVGKKREYEKHNPSRTDIEILRLITKYSTSTLLLTKQIYLGNNN